MHKSLFLLAAAVLLVASQTASADEASVRKAFAAGTGLADIGAVCDMPVFAEWDGYATLHGANASRAFLRVEREALTR